MTNILVAHHLSIIADLEPANGTNHRNEAFGAIDAAIATFRKVLCNTSLIVIIILIKIILNKNVYTSVALQKYIFSVVNVLPVELLYTLRLSLKAKFKTISKLQNYINQD